MHRQIGEVAKLAKVSVRMLRHYDELGLLVPSVRSEAGYRLYNQQDLERLQQILFYRALDFPLDAILHLMSADDFDRRQALLQQRHLLASKINSLQQVLNLVDRTLAHAHEESPMEANAMFDVFPDLTPEIVAEAERTWGNNPQFRESQRRMAGYSRADLEKLKAEQAALYAHLEQVFSAGCAPESTEAQHAVEALRQLECKWFFDCPPALFARIKQGISTDERFVKNLDANCPGLARWQAQAAAVLASRAE